MLGQADLAVFWSSAWGIVMWKSSNRAFAPAWGAALLCALVTALTLTLVAAPGALVDRAFATEGDPDGDGVFDPDDDCPHTAGVDKDPGFRGCVRVEQFVHHVLDQDTGGIVAQLRYNGSFPQCYEGVTVTLRTWQYTDHDPATGAVEEIQQGSTGADGYHEFGAPLPKGTLFEIHVSPQDAGGGAYCGSFTTPQYYYDVPVAREVTASYRQLRQAVVGRVTIAPDQNLGIASPCSDEQTAILTTATSPFTEIARTTFAGSDGSFSIDLSTPLELGVDYRIEIAARHGFDARVGAPDIGFPDECYAASTTFTTLPDGDEDGVPDAEDRCALVWGPTDGLVKGCTLLERRLSADYDGTTISGDLTVVPSGLPGTSSGCQESMRVEVTTRDPQGVARTTATTTKVGSAQTYSVEVGSLPSGTRYWASTSYQLEEARVLCGSATSETRVVDDADRDDVYDQVDPCPDVKGPSVGPTAGCPEVTRAVDATYRAGEISGRVRIAALGDAPAGSCSVVTTIRLYRVEASGPRTPVGTTQVTAVDGSFSVPLPSGAGSPVVAVAAGVFDGSRASCAQAESAPVAVGDRDGDAVPDDLDDCAGVPGRDATPYPGCPVVERVVSARYVAGSVTGLASPKDPAAQQAGACVGAPVAVTWAGASGAQVERTGTVLADESYAVDLPDVPPFDTELTVVFGSFHTASAYCPAKTVRVTVLRDGDGDTVPDAHDLCPAVTGKLQPWPNGCPDLTREATAAYAAGTVSGQVSVASPHGASCSTPGSVEVIRVTESAWETVGMGTTQSDGSYSVPVGTFRGDTRYLVWFESYLEPGAGLCAFAETSEQVWHDRDADTFADGEDRCSGSPGPEVDAAGYDASFPGCPVVRLAVTAMYQHGTVSGVVGPDNPALAPSGACAAPAEVTVYEIVDRADGRALRSGTTTLVDGAYAYSLDLDDYDLPGGAQLRVWARFPDTVVNGVAACPDERSEVVTVPVVDTDLDHDTVPDDVDRCDAAAGDEATQGCPVVLRSVGLDYGTGVVRGVVVLPAGTVEGVCTGLPVELVTEVEGVVTDPVTGHVADDGSFEFVLGSPLPAGAAYSVRLPAGFDDQGRAFCPEVESRARTVEAPADDDADDDGVPDDSDDCPTVHGPATGDLEGCPTLRRSVATTYSNRVVTVKVSSSDTVPGLAKPPCAAAPKVTVWMVGAGGQLAQVGVGATSGTGNTYSVRLGFRPSPGARILATAAANVVPGVAVCAAADAPLITVAG